MDTSGSSPIDICGTTGTRVLDPVDEVNNVPARLVIGWSDGSIGYALLADLSDQLNEEILVQIACSVPS